MLPHYGYKDIREKVASEHLHLFFNLGFRFPERNDGKKES
jgi:hypothetical protein